jgi:hypothetical protein
MRWYELYDSRASERREDFSKRIDASLGVISITLGKRRLWHDSAHRRRDVCCLGYGSVREFHTKLGLSCGTASRVRR